MKSKQPAPHICFTVTNDLTYDQRMHRICSSLSKAGFRVTLIGRKLKQSLPLSDKGFEQKRLTCLFNRGFAFYAEYNLRLFFCLLSLKMDGLCAIDLDTILPCFLVSKLQRVVRIYDAHEFFTELKEVRSRPVVQKVWTAIERLTVPNFEHGYTVSEGLAAEFRKRYGRDYIVVRNLPVLTPLKDLPKNEKLLVYQGAVNEGRGFESIIPAMKRINYKLIVCGDGNFMEQLKILIRQYNVQHKVEVKGMLLPQQLKEIAASATLGIGLTEKEGINQLHALPNKFLEYIHAGLPQIAMNFPEYRRINDEFRVALLLNNLDADAIADAVNSSMENDLLLQELRNNALRAREIYCWQNEEKKLISFYQQIFC